MKNNAAIMYAAVTNPAPSLFSLAFHEHFQHAPCNDETTGNVNAGNKDGDKSQDIDQAGAMADLHHGADHDNAGYGIGDRHQWRMQGVGYVPDHVIADYAGQDKHREVGQKLSGCVGADP